MREGRTAIGIQPCQPNQASCDPNCCMSNGLLGRPRESVEVSEKGEGMSGI